MNKKLFILLPVLALMLGACNNKGGKTDPTPEVIAVEAVELNHATATLEIGETLDLKAVVKPTTLEDRTVTWSSEHEEVASVSAGGRVTALKDGTSKIKAAANADKTKFAECTVTVNKKKVKVEVETPEANVAYKFGTFQKSNKVNKFIYFNSEVDPDSDYRLLTSDKLSEAVDVKLEAAEEGTWNFTFMQGEAKKYLNIGATDHHLAVEDEAKTNWEWDAEWHTIKAVGAANGDKYFPGTYNDYTTISGCAISMIESDYVFRFYQFVEEVPAESIAIEGGSSVFANCKIQLNAVLTPAAAVERPVEWSVEPANEHVSVKDGLVTVDKDATGTVTIKAEADGKSATKELTIGEALNYGTEEAPLTPAEGIALVDKILDEETGVEGATETSYPVYIQGIVSKSGAYTSYNNWDPIFLTNADGSVEEFFEIYRAKDGSEGETLKETYKAAGSLVGKKVLVTGFIYKYGKVYETTDKATKLLKVEEGGVAATSVVLNKTNPFEIIRGQSASLTAKLAPYGATPVAITWEISPSDDANVKVENGVITVGADAEVGKQFTVTAKAGELSASVKITVAKAALFSIDGTNSGIIAQIGKSATYLSNAFAFTVSEHAFSAGKDVGRPTASNAPKYNELGVLQFRNNKDGSTVEKKIDGIKNTAAIEGVRKIRVNFYSTYNTQGQNYLPLVKAGAAADSLEKVLPNETGTVSGIDTGMKDGTSNNRTIYEYAVTYTISTQTFFLIAGAQGATYVRNIEFFD